MKTQNFNSSLGQVKALLTTTKKIVANAQEMSPSDNYEGILEKIAEAEKRATIQTFQIAVMAMIKSGKSSFINALLGQEFLPMSNVPETAVSVIVRHSNNPAHKNGVLLDAGGQIAEGKEIKIKIAKLNDEKRDKNQVSNEQLILEAPLQYLVENNKPLDGVKFEILDTPGFGEAEVAILKSKHVTMVSEDILENVGLIIYLLDYTKLKGKEEEEILLKLKEFRPDLLKRVQDRLFFVVNKIDLENRTGLTPEQTADYVWKLVKSHIPSVKKANILTVSAGNALLARLILSGEAATEVVTDFAKQVFGYKGKDKTLEECKKEADDFLAVSNLPNIENEIINHIYKNRGGILIDTLVSDLEKIVKTFLNAKIKTAIATLRTNKDMMIALEKDIQKAKRNFGSLEEKKNQFAISKEWIKNEFNSYKDKEMIPNLLRIIEEQNDTISDKKDVESLINKLEEQAKTAFNQYKGRLESKIITKQRDLFSAFSKEAERLSQDFRRKLGRELNIDIDIDIIDIPELKVEAIVNNLYNKIDELIDQRQETHMRAENRYDPGSWCSRGKSWVEMIPQIKTIKTIRKGLIKELVENAVEEMNANAIDLAVQYANKAVTQEIGNAVKQFKEYADEYANTISLELAAIEKGGTQYVESRLKQLETIEIQTNTIINTIDKVKSFTENESKK